MLAMRIDMGEQPRYEPSRVREIRVIQTSLEELQNRLKIRQKGRKRVIDEFVHQTRTPLSILKMHLEGLGDGIITMSGEEIKVCQTQIDDLSAIISNMSMLLDADRPLQEVKAEQFDLHIMLQQIINGMKVAYDNKKINLHLNRSDKAVITTDKYKLSQSIYNLLANAYKFTDPNGEVMVSYELTDTAISIYIRDSGIGIAKEDMPHLFDAYYRGKNAERTSGDGLGLYVVKENVEQMGGTIAVHSKQGAGSEFILTIPVQCPAEC
jgi:signal transduction histidine kinase